LLTVILILAFVSIGSLLLNIRQRISKIRRVNSFNHQLIELNNSLEARVVERTQELEQKNHQLMNFAFINAHKLRAPVATLLGLINLYKHSGLNNNEREFFFNQVDQLTERLDSVIREMQRSLE
jgi:light-regulated signal transduction histidine kinase (bacteriophytochrome)